jgi:hypothetical protein
MIMMMMMTTWQALAINASGLLASTRVLHVVVDDGPAMARRLEDDFVAAGLGVGGRLRVWSLLGAGDEGERALFEYGA